MDKERKNAEGYSDPTAYEGIKRACKKEPEPTPVPASKFRPVVYICSPFSGDVKKNIAEARRYSRFAVDSGYIPITPHLLYPQFLNDDISEERELGLFFGMVLMDKCAEIWVCGNTVSSGMQAEIDRAKKKNYRIRYFTSHLKEVSS